MEGASSPDSWRGEGWGREPPCGAPLLHQRPHHMVQPHAGDPCEVVTLPWQYPRRQELVVHTCSSQSTFFQGAYCAMEVLRVCLALSCLPWALLASLWCATWLRLVQCLWNLSGMTSRFKFCPQPFGGKVVAFPWPARFACVGPLGCSTKLVSIILIWH